ncbi:alpha/beta fold hydrolase [Sphingomonas sp.]|uniref:alpha/beta fold hydrolase n=1 Tax=Sphingomonas sp. TaxID=28214 RepID=UPI003B0080CC
MRTAIAIMLAAATLALAPAALASPAQAGLQQHSLRVGGVRLHYAEMGSGNPVLLLPGWPEDGHAWRKVAPLLAARGRRVVILDPRGFGDSDKPASGYDLDTVAAEVHAFIGAAGLGRPGGIDVVTHDLGGWIGYALASAHPADVRRLVLSEVTIPSPTRQQPIPDDAANIKTWHFAFNRLPGLPEMLTTGHERAYLDWLFDNKATHPDAIDPPARSEYVRVFTAGGGHAGFNYYRALFSPAGLKRMGERTASPLPMPVLAIGASGGVGTLLIQSMKGAAIHLDGTVLQGCGHYLPEECPTAFADAVTGFWAGSPASRP